MPNLLTRSRLRPGRAVDLAVGPPAEEVHPDEVSAGGVRWLYLEKPLEDDRDWLQREFGFHSLDIEDVASRNQRPKLDAYDDYLFIVLHFPVFDKPSGRLLTAELDLFVGPDYLITLPDQNLPPLAAMFERYRERPEVREATFSKGTGYLLYRIVDTCVDASFPMLRKIGAKLDQLEDDIFEGKSDKIVQELSNAKQEIINFRRVVRPMRAVLRDLERTKQRYLAEDLDIYFDDITDAAERIWDVLENYKEVVEALEDSNESVLSHRLNESLRRPDRVQRRAAAAHAAGQHLRHELRPAGRGGPRGVLAGHRADGRDPPGRAAVLPAARLPLTRGPGRSRREQAAAHLTRTRIRHNLAVSGNGTALVNVGAASPRSGDAGGR